MIRINAVTKRCWELETLAKAPAVTEALTRHASQYRSWC